jgi:hypothetical protein
MGRVARFLAIFLAGIALLAYFASSAIQKATHRWFQEDMNQRAAALIKEAQPLLLAPWMAGNPETLSTALINLSRDGRMTAAGACDQNNQLLAHSPAFPSELTCVHIRQRMASEDETPSGV